LKVELEFVPEYGVELLILHVAACGLLVGDLKGFVAMLQMRRLCQASDMHPVKTLALVAPHRALAVPVQSDTLLSFLQHHRC